MFPILFLTFCVDISDINVKFRKFKNWHLIIVISGRRELRFMNRNNMKIGTAYVRASMSKRLRAVKEPEPKRHRAKCGMKKSGLLGSVIRGEVYEGVTC